MATTKILFLCQTNMCLSPLAEGLLKSVLEKRNIDANVDSAGFEAYHINEFPDKRAIKKCKDNGIDISAKRVRLFSPDDFDKFDKIYVMDNLTNRSALYFARNDEDKNKIDFLMNLITPGNNQSVTDCFFEKLEAGDETYKMIEQACSVIATKVIKS
jgi:protein-tyrosine phosphatase